MLGILGCMLEAADRMSDHILGQIQLAAGSGSRTVLPAVDRNLVVGSHRHLVLQRKMDMRVE